jgi:hypothetical protein
MSKVKWVALAETAKTESEVRDLLMKIEDYMLSTGKMTKDMDKAMDILLGTSATKQDDVLPMEYFEEDIFAEKSE